MKVNTESFGKLDYVLYNNTNIISQILILLTKICKI